MKTQKAENIRYGIVNRLTDSTMFAYSGWPSVCFDPVNERLYSVCSGYRMNHVCPFGKTVMNIGKIKGDDIIWSNTIIVNDTELDDRDAGIIYLGDNRLLVSWFTHPAQAYEHEYSYGMISGLSPSESGMILAKLASYRYLSDERRKGGSYVRLSCDGGFTWGDIVKVPVSAPHGPNVLKSGRLIYLGKEMYSEGIEEKGIIAAYSSDDCGLSWRRLSELSLPNDGTSWNNFHEPHVLEIPDGTLLGVIRAQGNEVAHGFTVYICRSSDGGITWTVPTPIDGISGSPPHLMLHSSGAVICSFARREAPASERAIVSFDGGITWEKEYILDDRQKNADLGYPASVEIAGGEILTVYYQRYENDSKTSILSSRWSL